MNLDLTYRRARYLFGLNKEPNRLLQLPASATMETTGDVFNRDYDMIDDIREIVYRKEQFSQGDDIPTEVLVWARGYRKREIEAMCFCNGLNVLWSRYVHAEGWDSLVDPEDDNAKEIVLLCEGRED